MSKALRIQVPQPCHENWQNMTPKEQGRFCGSCQKIVVDFSAMSDKEMLDHISKAAGQSMCGRFANDQLNRTIEPAAKKRRFSFAYAWSLLLATLLFFESCDESTTGEIMPVEAVEEETVGKIAVDDSTVCSQPLTEIKGEILNENTGLPVAGAEIYIITGRPRKVVSDSMGKFSISGDASNSAILEISAKDFIRKTVQLDSTSDRQHVKVMMRDIYTKGEFIVDEDAVNGGKNDCKNK